MDSGGYSTFANLLGPRVEPHGKNAHCIRFLDVLLEAITYHQCVRNRDVKIIQNVMIKRFSLWKVCILKAIDVGEIYIQSAARQCPADLTFIRNGGAGCQNHAPPASL